MLFIKGDFLKIFLVSLFMIGISIPKSYAAIDVRTQKAAAQLGAKDVIEISFDQSSSTLSKNAQKELDALISLAKKNGDVSEIKVVAWADQEYPRKQTTIAKDQRDLAENRAGAVQNYIEKNSDFGHVKTYNMAKRPNVIQETLNTPDASTKNVLEQNKAAPSTDKETGLFNLKGKASHVVVMVSYK